MNTLHEQQFNREAERAVELANKAQTTEESYRYDISVDALTGWFRNRNTMQKILLTVGAPLLIVCCTAAFAFFGLGHVAEALESPDPRVLAKAAAEVDLLRQMMVGAIAVSLLFTLLLFKAIRTDIVRTSRQLIDCLRRISDGQHDIVVPHQDREDEYGELGIEIERMRLASIELVGLTQERAERAETELNEQAKLQAEREDAQRANERALFELASQFERTVGDVVSGVAAASSQLQITSQTMASAAEETSQRTNEVASSMEEANTGATSAAAASDQFAHSIGEVSRQAASSAELARRANLSAQEANSTISELSVSAEQVGEIVELIQTIAQRTNLLALNASIEAARGGEAGRGFAVVASEVKELAMQTSRATEQVAEQIRAIQEKTGASVGALRSIESEVQQLETTAVSIASAVDEQSVAGQDLARSIDLAARGTDRVTDHIDDVRKLSLSTGAAASQVLSSAANLEEQASILSEQVEQFLLRVRGS